MKIKLTFVSILFNLFCFSQSAKDSLKKFGFYASMEVINPIYYSEKLGEKYFDPTIYTLQWKRFEFKTPSIGIGYFYRHKALFFRTELAYWYGLKNAATEGYFSANNIEGVSIHYTGPPTNEVGKIYYSYYEHSSGNLQLHNLDLELVLGRTVGKKISAFSGIKVNKIIYYNYTGYLTRSGNKYSSNGWYAASTKLEEVNIEYESKEIKKTKFQKLTGILFLDFGCNLFYSIGKTPCFTEFVFNLPVGNGYNSNKAYLGMKFGFSIYNLNTKKSTDNP